MRAGIGLRDPYFREIDETRPGIGWLEVHTENFFGHDWQRHARLERLRAAYPLSFHGVGLSLGSVDPPDSRHLAEVRRLVEHYQPWIVSEHCCWGGIGGIHSNNLLPLPRTREALDVLCDNIVRVQDALRRTIAIENISTYLEFEHGEMSEPAFLSELARRSGCTLLLDLDNLYINSFNHGFSASSHLDAIPAEAVAEYHLAGHENHGHTLIDTHSRPVPEAVWALYTQALRRIGPRPTLIERDNDIPALPHLLAEMRHADSLRTELPSEPA